MSDAQAIERPQDEAPATPMYREQIVHPGAWAVSDFASPAVTMVRARAEAAAAR